MTPKEEAKNLVDKFMQLVDAYSSQGQVDNAKECALIAVDEMIKQCWDYRDLDLQKSYDYGQQVKQEIQKL